LKNIGGAPCSAPIARTSCASRLGGARQERAAAAGQREDDTAPVGRIAASGGQAALDQAGHHHRDRARVGECARRQAPDGDVGFGGQLAQDEQLGAGDRGAPLDGVRADPQGAHQAAQVVERAGGRRRRLHGIPCITPGPPGASRRSGWSVRAGLVREIRRLRVIGCNRLLGAEVDVRLGPRCRLARGRVFRCRVPRRAAAAGRSAR